MNPMRQPPAYEELDLEGQDLDAPQVPQPGHMRGTPSPSSPVAAALLLHYAQIPVNLRAYVWYWYVAIPRTIAWMTALLLLVCTLQVLSQRGARLTNMNVACPVTEVVQLQAPCQFCNVAVAARIVERANYSVRSWPKCSAPQVLHQPQILVFDSAKEFECDSDMVNNSFGAKITVSFWVWYMEDKTAHYDRTTYNARVTHALTFSCTDNATSFPSALDVQIDRRVYQKEQPWLASGKLIWNRLFIASKPAHGFAVLP